MLFNSYVFIFLFLPITLFVYFTFEKRNSTGFAFVWLVCASLFYYGWWQPAYLALILFSIVINYLCGILIVKTFFFKKTVLTSGIIFNLSLLGYFKYFNFFIDNLNILGGTSFHFKTIVLPLAISFFTFQQIAYLVDTYYNKTEAHNFFQYCLFAY